MKIYREPYRGIRKGSPVAGYTLSVLPPSHPHRLFLSVQVESWTHIARGRRLYEWAVRVGERYLRVDGQLLKVDLTASSDSRFFFSEKKALANASDLAPRLTMNGLGVTAAALVRWEMRSADARQHEYWRKEQQTRLSPAPALYYESGDPIETLGFSSLTAKGLHRGEISTIGELLLLTVNDLLDIRRFGPQRVEEVLFKLESAGLALGDPASIRRQPHRFGLTMSASVRFE